MAEDVHIGFVRNVLLSIIINKKYDFVNLLYMQPENIKRKARNIETTEKKLVNAKIAVILNNTCLNENLLRDFLIYIFIYVKIISKL